MHSDSLHNRKLASSMTALDMSSCHPPGDDIHPDASMIYDQTRVVNASAEEIYPWLLQLGRSRGGWYLTSFWERFIPASWRATRAINPHWQELKVGDRIPDYGAHDDYFDVALLEPPRAIVYKSERFGLPFTWALLVRETETGSGRETSVVHLRFRGALQVTGLKRRIILLFGEFMDYISTAPMLAGLAERVERQHAQ